MKGSERIQISSDQFFAKLILTLAIFIIGVILYYDSRPIANPDFKMIAEYWIIFVGSVLSLVYLFTFPAVYYDINNLHIKKAGKTEIHIPLGNIKSIHEHFFSPKWGSFYSIHYISDANQLKKVKFYVSNFSTTISKFISDIKNQNTEVIIS